jgi:bifunctional DNase/RNase
MLGLRVGAVKTRLFRSRSRLRQTIVNRYNQEYFATYGQRRLKSMVKVEVLDVFRSEGRSTQLVLLLDRTVPRVLLILVGEFEAKAMALNSRGVQLPRPMTYQLMPQLLEAVGGEIDHVRVEAMRATTFFAVIVVRGPEGTREVDARPSDAVMDRCGVEIPFASDTVFNSHGIETSNRQFLEGAPSSERRIDEKAVEELREAVLDHVKSLREN